MRVTMKIVTYATLGYSNANDAGVVRENYPRIALVFRCMESSGKESCTMNLILLTDNGRH